MRPISRNEYPLARRRRTSCSIFGDRCRGIYALPVSSSNDGWLTEKLRGPFESTGVEGVPERRYVPAHGSSRQSEIVDIAPPTRTPQAQVLATLRTCRGSARRGGRGCRPDARDSRAGGAPAGCHQEAQGRQHGQDGHGRRSARPCSPTKCRPTGPGSRIVAALAKGRPDHPYIAP